MRDMIIKTNGRGGWATTRDNPYTPIPLNPYTPIPLPDSMNCRGIGV